ncbi:MAG: branched-chain amino acid ABC transporter permease [Burkholderiales bacterium]|jgi:branched-chain amino acid transport system permease protein|nr:branched-chain amino acid ABC transporter permease [Burkholderiales bacterium]
MSAALRSHAGLVVLALLLLAFPLLNPGSFVLDLATRIGLTAVVVIGLNLLFGYAGQVSLGHAAFFGLGGYASAILTTHLGWPPLAALAGGALAVGVLAFVIARPILKLAGYHLAMATLSLAFIVTVVCNNEKAWTGGSDGMPVPPFTLFGWTLEGEKPWYAVAALCLLLVTWGATNLARSPAGRALQAIRGSEVAARLSGIDVARAKTRVFVLSAVLASVMGSLMAHQAGFITPAATGLTRSVEFLMMVVLGGMASIYGSIVGAALVMLLPQVLHAFGAWETLVMGVLLTGTLVFMRDGIVPTLRLRLRLPRAARRKTVPAAPAFESREPSA